MVGAPRRHATIGRSSTPRGEVFVADPEAPISKVAQRAGVGISALYRRYASKEDLLRRLCADGLRSYIAAAEDALADEGDPWAAFAEFMRRVVDADTHSLTLRLAGTFTPTDELYRDSQKAHRSSTSGWSSVPEPQALFALTS